MSTSNGNGLPKIGFYICHCGINIGSVVNVPEVVDYIRKIPGVTYAEHNLYTCSQDTQERIVERIREQGLNRVVVASCTPRTHEPLFQQTIREQGLNVHLFEMANIRDQCSWVHAGDRHAATYKAEDLVRMAVARAGTLHLDDFGAEIGEQLGAPRPGEHPGQVEHPQVAQRVHRAALRAALLGMSASRRPYAFMFGALIAARLANGAAIDVP